MILFFFFKKREGEKKNVNYKWTRLVKFGIQVGNVPVNPLYAIPLFISKEEKKIENKLFWKKQKSISIQISYRCKLWHTCWKGSS